MIPTSEDFLKMCSKNRHGNLLNPREDLIEFAKLHVTEALKQASEKAEINVLDYNNYEVDKESILNAYNLDEIK